MHPRQLFPPEFNHETLALAGTGSASTIGYADALVMHATGLESVSTASVVLNRDGQVITAWATGSNGWRNP